MKDSDSLMFDHFNCSIERPIEVCSFPWSTTCIDWQVGRRCWIRSSWLVIVLGRRKLRCSYSYAKCKIHAFSFILQQKDWSQQIVPDIWPEAAPRTPITTIEWFRESELKHGRLAMLAVLGWVAVDAGLRFPGEAYSAIPNSLAAHTAAVQNGSMG